MPNLQALSQRITSVKSTKKITGAMKMIAAARVKTCGVHLKDARQQKNGLVDMTFPLLDFFQTRQGLEGPLFGESKAPKKILYLLIASDKGLCGGYNMNLLRSFREHKAEREKGGASVKVRILGSKLIPSFRSRYPENFLESPPFAIDVRQFTPLAAVALGQRLVADQLALTYEAVYIIYNHFVNSLTQEVRTLALLPLSHFKTAAQEAAKNRSAPQEEAGSPGENYFYEPSDNGALEGSVLPLVTGVLLYCIRHAQSAEIAARMTAMDNATRNATDMIDQLSLQKNRIRQSLITTELTEIISGAEAL